MNPNIAVKIAVLLCLTALIEAVPEYVSKTPRTKAELEPVCRRATADATMRQHWAYGDPKSVTCPKIIKGPKVKWITPEYPLKARIESPTGFTKDGKEEYLVACCYQQKKAIPSRPSFG